MLYKKLVSLFLLVFLASRICIAETKPPEFTTVKTGEPAPFFGYLFTPQAIAQMLTTIDEDKRKQEAEHTAEVKSLRLDVQAETERRIADNAANANLLEQLRRAKEEQLRERDKKIASLEGQKFIDNILIAGSFVAGVALTAGIVYLTAGAVR